ncbi:MAG: hypothetical protein A2Y56_06925 [Candidatus Aminicenantes bacterium RBG_13_63_10]|nr:MAG: hypothetical protein A2Y56_06925 [Candidatus Aminicenantes bacterium RBG_13_63_10]
MRTKIALAAVLCAGLAACMLMSSGKTFYSGAPKFSPTSSDSIAILRDIPSESYVKLGEVWVIPKPDWSASYVETQLRQAAASLGANAVVIVHDQFLGGAVVPGFTQGASVQPKGGVTGVAVRYQ